MPKRGKGCYSSFFPDAWDEERTLEEIAYAFGNKKPIPGFKQKFLGQSTDGITIEILIDEAGNIASAFPHFPNTP